MHMHIHMHMYMHTWAKEIPWQPQKEVENMQEVLSTDYYKDLSEHERYPQSSARPFTAVVIQHCYWLNRDVAKATDF